MLEIACAVQLPPTPNPNRSSRRRRVENVRILSSLFYFSARAA